ncbi:MAG: metallophosphoesterase family protein [Emergencia sp.]|nr:metallophosphoesterase [Emergencia sp.]
MKILVLSDTHGSLKKAGQIYKKLTDVDLLIHCGDHIGDAKTLSDVWGIPVVCVQGNCDGLRDRQFQIADTPAGRILVTHGHMEQVGFDLSKLLYLVQENNCIAACFGHTHIPLCENIDGIWLINPGSLPNPRDGKNGSYAVIHAEEDDFHVRIVYYDDVCKEDPPEAPPTQTAKKTSKKARGGFLRDLLNYSDRF